MTTMGVSSDWRARAREVAAIAARHADAVDHEARFPAEAVAALRLAGLLGAQVPVRFGGGGLPLRLIGAIAAELGEACGATGMIFAMHQIQVACLARHHGEQPCLLALLADVAQAPLLLASVTSEVGVGGEIRRSLCAVEPLADGFRLLKHGSTISYGAEADGYLVTARADRDAAPGAQVLLAARREQAVLERAGGWDTMGMRGTCSDGFTIELRGAGGQIFGAPFAEIASATMLPVSHLLWSSLWFGIARDAFFRARAHLRSASKTAAAPLPGTEALAELFARMRMLQAVLAAAFAAAEAEDAASPQDRAIGRAADHLMLKTVMSEGCLDAARRAMALIGFAAFRNGGQSSLGRHVRDLSSAPLMINNARLTETMSRFLLRGPLGLEIA